METDRKTVLLAGASGYIGRAVLAELTARGHRVIALYRDADQARSADKSATCDARALSLDDATELAAALHDADVDTVVSCIASRSGTARDADRVDDAANRHLLAAARQRGATHFVLLSAICVQKPRLAFQHAKLRFERHLAAARIEHTIVRPTAFFKSLSGQIERVRAGRPFLVFGAGTETACKPISERDLAHFLADCVDDPDRRNRVLAVGGPGPALTPLDQGALLFELAGREPRFRHLSPRWFLRAHALLKPFAKLVPALADKTELLRIGHYYATESMLVWDEAAGRYDADATPEFGSDTLRAHYARALNADSFDDQLGDQKLF